MNSYFAKVSDKLITDKRPFNDHNADVYKLLHEAQSGFRKHYSCQTALIKLINDWLSHIDKGNIIGAKKLLMSLIVKYFCKTWLYTALEAHLFAGLNHAFKQISEYRGWVENVKSPVSQKRCTSWIRTGTGSVLFINDMPLDLQTYIDIYADDTITHTAVKTGSGWT